MEKLRFPQLPLAAKLAIALVPFMGWVMFAEFVIDRQGWHTYLPLYRFGEFCTYDAIVLLASFGAWWRCERVFKRESEDEAAAATREVRATGACC